MEEGRQAGGFLGGRLNSFFIVGFFHDRSVSVEVGSLGRPIFRECGAETGIVYMDL